jgi:hypothetical protein
MPNYWLNSKATSEQPPAQRPNPTVQPAPDPDIDDHQRQRIRDQLSIFRPQLGHNDSAS